MKNVPLVAAGLLLAVIVGAGVWLASDDEPRREGALASGSGLKSPNGQFAIDVTDDGIVLRGPSATVKVLGDSVQVESKTATVDVGSAFNVDSAGTVLVNASGTFRAQASATASVNGAVLRLGCSSGGQRVARQGDSVSVPGVAATVPIVTGSSTVFAC